MLSMIGLIGGLLLLIVLTMRGMNLFIAGPLSALVVALTSGMPLFPQLVKEGEANFVGNYMSGFTGFIASWYLMFLSISVRLGTLRGGLVTANSSTFCEMFFSSNAPSFAVVIGKSTFNFW